MELLYQLSEYIAQERYLHRKFNYNGDMLLQVRSKSRLILWRWNEIFKTLELQRQTGAIASNYQQKPPTRANQEPGLGLFEACRPESEKTSYWKLDGKLKGLTKLTRKLVVAAMGAAVS
ncbi:MAG: hypothetical protein LQ341_007161 [Variospora aurantia]|nr:MAG: hypothetical protein LQ341_007161 [Variospora aurantia]